MKNFLILFLAMLCNIAATAQDSSNTVTAFSHNMLDKVTKAQMDATDKINVLNEKLLKKMQRNEEKIYRKLFALDSTITKNGYGGIEAKYKTLEAKINDPASLLAAGSNGKYIPRLDSLQTMLKFLKPLAGQTGKIDKALGSVDKLKAGLSGTEAVNAFLESQKNNLQNLLKSYTTLSPGILKSINKYSREFYYYKERITNLKEEINSPEKIEATALKLLNKIPAFQKFMQENSELAKLFGSPAGAVPNIAGLQTRQALMQQLQQQFGAAGINPQQFLQQQLQGAQGELNQLKAKANSLRSGEMGNGDASMPDFKPNNQKSKPFLKRLEYGFDLQSGIKQYQFPASNAIAVNAGYKLSDRFTTSIGLAYKFSLGESIKKIRYTNDGIGFRSFIDFKISTPQKGIRVLFSNIWITGGYEINYWSKFKINSELKELVWQSSGLIGLTKKIQYKKKSAKVQVLWDFLSYQQAPGTQPIFFRAGYSFTK